MTQRFGLTKRQRDCFDFIKKEITESGVSPSYEQIADALGLASKSGINRLVHSLIERGYLVKIEGKRRSLGLSEAV